MIIIATVNEKIKPLTSEKLIDMESSQTIGASEGENCKEA